jgi:hypothetical protein
MGTKHPPDSPKVYLLCRQYLKLLGKLSFDRSKWSSLVTIPSTSYQLPEKGSMAAALGVSLP